MKDSSFIEVEHLGSDANGRVAFNKMLINTDEIAAISDTAILVSGQWLDVRDGREIVLHKLTEAYKKSKEPQQPVTAAASSAVPSAAL